MLGNNSSSNYDYAQDSSEKRKHERERDHRNNRGSADGARPAGRAHHSRDHKDEQQAKAAKDDQKANRHHSNKDNKRGAAPGGNRSGGKNERVRDRHDEHRQQNDQAVSDSLDSASDSQSAPKSNSSYCDGEFNDHFNRQHMMNSNSDSSNQEQDQQIQDRPPNIQDQDARVQEDGDMSSSVDSNQEITLHSNVFKVIEVNNTGSQANIYYGIIIDMDAFPEYDVPYMQGSVVLKQFPLRTDHDGFKKELKILKKIKSLKLKSNGGFPRILSAKLSNSVGEILMSYCGKDMFEFCSVNTSLLDPGQHVRLGFKELSEFGIQLTSQLQFLHQLGYTHNDMKLQNICFDKPNNSYTLIDFASAECLYNKNGQLKSVQKLPSFQGNVLFASDSQMLCNSTSRKDELESLIYMIAFLYNGEVPVSKYMHDQIDQVPLQRFLDDMIKFRIDNQQRNVLEICENLPQNLPNTLKTIQNMQWIQKPSYDQVRQSMVLDINIPSDKSLKIKIHNHQLAEKIMYEYLSDPQGFCGAGIAAGAQVDNRQAMGQGPNQMHDAIRQPAQLSGQIPLINVANHHHLLQNLPQHYNHAAMLMGNQPQQQPQPQLNQEAIGDNDAEGLVGNVDEQINFNGVDSQMMYYNRNLADIQESQLNQMVRRNQLYHRAGGIIRGGARGKFQQQPVPPMAQVNQQMVQQVAPQIQNLPQAIPQPQQLQVPNLLGAQADLQQLVMQHQGNNQGQIMDNQPQPMQRQLSNSNQLMAPNLAQIAALNMQNQQFQLQMAAANNFMINPNQVGAQYQPIQFQNPQQQQQFIAQQLIQQPLLVQQQQLAPQAAGLGQPVVPQNQNQQN